jgi:hypothetical protein
MLSRSLFFGIHFVVFCVMKVLFAFSSFACWPEMQVSNNLYFQQNIICVRHCLLSINVFICFVYLFIFLSCCRWYSVFMSDINSSFVSLKISNSQFNFQSGAVVGLLAFLLDFVDIGTEFVSNLR